jgi:hypothetical protein
MRALLYGSLALLVAAPAARADDLNCYQMRLAANGMTAVAERREMTPHVAGYLMDVGTKGTIDTWNAFLPDELNRAGQDWPPFWEWSQEAADDAVMLFERCAMQVDNPDQKRELRRGGETLQRMYDLHLVAEVNRASLRELASDTLDGTFDTLESLTPLVSKAVKIARMKGAGPQFTRDQAGRVAGFIRTRAREIGARHLTRYETDDSLDSRADLEAAETIHERFVELRRRYTRNKLHKLAGFMTREIETPFRKLVGTADELIAGRILDRALAQAAPGTPALAALVTVRERAAARGYVSEHGEKLNRAIRATATDRLKEIQTGFKRQMAADARQTILDSDTPDIRVLLEGRPDLPFGKVKLSRLAESYAARGLVATQYFENGMGNRVLSLAPVDGADVSRSVYKAVPRTIDIVFAPHPDAANLWTAIRSVDNMQDGKIGSYPMTHSDWRKFHRTLKRVRYDVTQRSPDADYP